MNANLPDPKIPKRIFNILPEELGLQNEPLAEFVQQDFETDQQQSAATSVSNRIFQGQKKSNGVPVPLTEEEAKLADKAIEDTVARIGATTARIEKIKTIVDDQISKSVGIGGDLAFKLDISKKGSYKKAVKALFGYKTDEITYEMYKQMVKAKAILEEQEGKAYYEGTLQDQED